MLLYSTDDEVSATASHTRDLGGETLPATLLSDIRCLGCSEGQRNLSEVHQDATRSVGQMEGKPRLK